MDRKTFLKTVCGAGACGCMAALLDWQADRLSAAAPQSSDGRLVFTRYQVANMARLMAASPAASACSEILEGTGRECSKVGGMAARFKGDPDGYMAAMKRAWNTDFAWDKARGVVTVSVAEGPCGCPLVDNTRTPAFWCSCSVGYQKESFSTVFGKPVQATLKASKLDGSPRCVFEVQVGGKV